MPLRCPAPGAAGRATSTHLPASILGRRAGAPRATSQCLSDVEATSGQIMSGFLKSESFLGLIPTITWSHSSAPLGEDEVNGHQPILATHKQRGSPVTNTNGAQTREQGPSSCPHEGNTVQESQRGTIKTLTPGPMQTLLLAPPAMLGGRTISTDKPRPPFGRWVAETLHRREWPKARCPQAVATTGRLKDAPMGSPFSTKRTEKTQSAEHLLVLRTSLTPAGPSRPQTTEATEGIATAPPTAPKSQLPGPRTRRPVLEPRGSEGAFFPTPTPTDTRGRASPAADRARERAGRAVPPARGRGLGGLPPSLGHRPRRRRSPSPYPLRGPARPPGPEAQPSRGKGSAGADRREDTYLKGYIVSLPALPGPPVTRARTSRPMTSAQRLSSTAHRLTPP
ncbi:hypothetical protein HPG69_000360 [Diceros bicornis minor]|uniref:Uncharacterized protein n=1 Tax=Diceros bicornis minor TaxID=77932 RepID=A0A7J7EVE6_DICBM|nr:hypothetical protein HPG69_000360 [Diceros bicornis minor]